MAATQRTKHTIDATGKILGRLASEIATLLRGKNKPTYTPNIDAGDRVEVLNVAAIRVTGDKESKKEYHHFTGYPGGYKSMQLRVLKAKNPAEVLRRAVDGMLPKNRLRPTQLKRLTFRT
ncbi:50S ribosomal protein L13 [Candidatus Uhrbacteria bacterium]|nr:50S ribosomal protein L13 [Candidatus Uhrbacteria bacterium]